LAWRIEARHHMRAFEVDTITLAQTITRFDDLV